MTFEACQLVDLSVCLGPGPSEAVPVAIEYFDHHAGGAHLATLAGVEPAALPGTLGWASERLTAVTHAGTHIDAPFHYAPTCGGQPSRTIDELPVEWFWGPAVCVDAANEPESALIETREVEAFERRWGCCIGSGTIVLFHTGARYGDAGFNERGRALAPELVESLASRGVQVLGTDAWSIDPPFSRERPADGPVWAAHFVGYRREFCVIERLCNLQRLPPAGFWLACFPIKVRRGSAGWARPVALLPPGVARRDENRAG